MWWYKDDWRLEEIVVESHVIVPKPREVGGEEGVCTWLSIALRAKSLASLSITQFKRSIGVSVLDVES